MQTGKRLQLGVRVCVADVAVHTPLIVAVFDFGQGRTGWDPRVEGGGEPGGEGGGTTAAGWVCFVGRRRRDCTLSLVVQT